MNLFPASQVVQLRFIFPSQKFNVSSHLSISILKEDFWGSLAPTQ
jgi:hypothetical protein